MFSRNERQHTPAAAGAAHERSKLEIETVVKRFASANHVGAIAVGAWPHDAKEHEQAWVFTEGHVRGADSAAPDRRTIWQIGSVTKTFTATLLASTVSAGRIALLDNVENFAPAGAVLPRFSTWQASLPIRFLDLATHTAGLPADPQVVPAGGYSVPAMYADLARYGLAVPPGKWWNYSNQGFALLANVLTSLADADSFAQMVEELKNVSKLALPDTVITLTPDHQTRLAWGFASGVRALWRSNTWPAFDGSGALYSTLDDMLVWLAYNLGVADSPIDNLLPMIQQVYFDDGTNIMGLAWQYNRLPDATLYMNKGGQTQGFASFIASVKQERIGVVILTNESTAYPQTLAEEILIILRQSR
jgi:D-alanyl-D-alanine-carboxypeptidase/D-alanyl-D-alanine-endopeptidase